MQKFFDIQLYTLFALNSSNCSASEGFTVAYIYFFVWKTNVCCQTKAIGFYTKQFKSNALYGIRSSL